jgi:hypothetical protein
LSYHEDFGETWLGACPMPAVAISQYQDNVHQVRRETNPSRNDITSINIVPPVFDGHFRDSPQISTLAGFIGICEEM